jgi:signal recognition particle receptor subunit beta
MPEVKARILLWGISGSGKTTTLETIHEKLRPALRGEIQQHPTRLDPTVHYESLEISLGEVAGVATRIEIIAVPGAPEQAMTRKQLLDEVDGIVLVLDASPERINVNSEAIDELRSSLAAYGQRLDAFPLVLQYNKRDVADPFAIEDLHRRIGLSQAAVFETIATSGHGILATLTTISKYVVRARRNDGSQSMTQAPPSASTQAPAAATTREPTAPIPDGREPSHEILEAAILAESDAEDYDELSAISDLDPITRTQPDWQAIGGDSNKPEAGLGGELRIVSVGQASVEADGELRLPLVLGDETGQTRSVMLSLRLDSLVPGGSD